MESAELPGRLLETIESLGEKERVVTTFYFYEGLTLREIGRALNLTEGRMHLPDSAPRSREAHRGPI